MDDVRWLDDDEMRVWRGFVEVGGRLFPLLSSELKADADMTFEDYEVLVHLSEHPDRRLRMSDLSDKLLHSQSRVTQRVDRLVDRGWVVREKCPEDRRGTYAVLTPDGMAAIEAAAPGHVRAVRELLVDLVDPSEMASLADVLERIAAKAREHS
jgi:DNA-binding MarR family transcriptional regulator